MGGGGVLKFYKKEGGTAEKGRHRRPYRVGAVGGTSFMRGDGEKGGYRGQRQVRDNLTGRKKRN